MSENSAEKPAQGKEKESEITLRVVAILAERLGGPLHRMGPSTSIMDDLGADSLDVLVIAARIEKEFKVKVPTTVMSQIRTIQDITNVICDALAGELPRDIE